MEKIILHIKTIFAGVSILGYALLLSCSDGIVYDKNVDISNSEFQTFLNDLQSEAELPRNALYQDSLEVLNSLGIYTFDSDDLLNCNKDDLQSYYLRRQLPVELVKLIRIKTERMTGDEIFEYLLRVAEMTSDKLEEEFQTLNTANNQNNVIDELQDSMVTHLMWLSSKRGNVEALNEVGAAQVYCYQGTEQDVESAIIALKKAAEKGDSLSMLTLGKIYYTGLGGYNDPELGKKLQEQAFELTIHKLRNARMDIESFAKSKIEDK